MINDQKVLVTGATGFIGRRLCLELARRGHAVKALCRNTSHPYAVRHPLIEWVKGDILDKDSLLHAVLGCTHIYHTAALAKMWSRRPEDFYTVNVIGTRNVLEVAGDLGVSRIVYTSTCGVLGPTVLHPMTEDDPRSTGFPIAYERTKHLAELEVKSFVQKGWDIVTVNPSRVFGEGPVTDSNTVGKLVCGYLKGRWRIIPGNGEQAANYVYLDDVVRGHIQAMELGRSGDRYILGGEDISFNQFFELLQRITGRRRYMLKLPLGVIKLYSRFEWAKSKLTGLTPVFLPEFADRLKYDQKYDSGKALRQLKYRITPFEEGFAKTVRYLEKQLV